MPFRVTMKAATDTSKTSKPTAMYVRAVSCRDSVRRSEYNFYRVDGGCRLFNRSDPQQVADADLPAPRAWETQAFVMQTVPLAPFPAGRYELEVSVRDRLTRAATTGVVAFTVVSGVR